jgi:hypothetical protein
MHRCSPDKHRRPVPLKWPKIPPELEPPRAELERSIVAALLTLALTIGLAAGLSIASLAKLRIDLVVNLPPAESDTVPPAVPNLAEAIANQERAPLPPTQRAVVRAVGGPRGVYLEAHCDDDTLAREHDLLALMRDEPGKAQPTFVGLVDVVRVRDSRFVAVALGGKPALGDTLLIEAVDEFGAGR